MVSKVLLVIQVALDDQDHQANLVHLELKDLKEKLGHKVAMVPLVNRVLLVLLESEVSLACLDPMVHPDCVEELELLQV